jgi:hypothetical protein
MKANRIFAKILGTLAMGAGVSAFVCSIGVCLITNFKFIRYDSDTYVVAGILVWSCLGAAFLLSLPLAFFDRPKSRTTCALALLAFVALALSAPFAQTKSVTTVARTATPPWQ